MTKVMELVTRLATMLSVVLFSTPTAGEPVQYCQFGHETGHADFCLGILTHLNSSTNMHDIYLSLSVTRDSEIGWTAVGTGSLMAGALMFIVYGDPDEREAPVLSIRTVKGHKQPGLVRRENMGGADLRVMQAQWMQTTPSAKYEQYALSSSYRAQSARFSLVCYSCEAWPGTPIVPMSVSQPWIWAWNDQQKLEVYSFDAELDMHSHGAGNGGWGHFYIDMARSVAQPGNYLPSFPPLRPNVMTVGASDTPIGVAGIISDVVATWHKLQMTAPLQRAHGILMASSFLLVFPAGVLALRSGSPSAFTYHWLFQGLATMCMLTGAGLGIFLVQAHGHGNGKVHASSFAAGAPGHHLGHSKRHDESSASMAAIFTTHKWLGGTLVIFVLLQIVLGWWHHLIFVRIQARTWVSYAHIWLGRTEIVGGCVNLLLGMSLAGYNIVSINAAVAFIMLDALVVVYFLYHRSRVASNSKAMGKP